MMEPGYYRAKPVAAKLGLAGTGSETIAVLFEFIEPAGERMTWYGYFTEGTRERTIKALRDCGWVGTDLSEFAEGKPIPAGFDREVELVLKNEAYNGKTTLKIAFINGGGGIALKTALTLDQARAFSARMKGVVIAFDRASGNTPTRSAPKGVPVPSEGTPIDMLNEQAGGAPSDDDDDMPL